MMAELNKPLLAGIARCTLAAAARRPSEDRDPVRVAAELRDVIVHPLQRQLLVQRAKVAGALVGTRAHSAAAEEAEGAQTVVDADDHSAVCPNEGGHALRVRVVAGTGGEVAPVEPDCHREQFCGQCVDRGRGRRRDVQEQAILTHFLHPTAAAGPHARGARTSGIDDGLGRRWHRLLPAARCAITDAAEEAAELG